MTTYDREPTTAEELFFHNLKAAQDGPTTRTKIKAVIAQEVMPHLQAIEENTGWLSKFVANIFKSGAGEAEKKYPSRKK